VALAASAERTGCVSEKDGQSHLSNVDRARMRDDPAKLAEQLAQGEVWRAETKEVTDKSYSWEEPLYRREDDNHPENVPNDKLPRTRPRWRPPTQQQTSARHARRSTDNPMIDLSDAVDRTVSGGVGMASVSEVLAAINHIKAGVDTEITAGLRATMGRCEEIQGLLSILMADNNPGQLTTAMSGLFEIVENAGRSMAVAQYVMESLDAYASLIQRGQ
jgi:hypothetical protein